jgi:FkbM family methyltransferase
MKRRSSPLMSLAAWGARVLPSRLKRAIYRIDPLARLVRSSLNRSAPDGLTAVDVAAGGLAGVRLKLDLQAEKDYWLGTYEPDLQMAVRELVRPGGVIYDVGANIGYISLLLARQAGLSGRVFAFEALPDNLDRLSENLRLNEIGRRVETVAAAVVDKAGPVRFLIGPSGGTGKADGSAGRQELTYARTVEVRGLALDEFVYGEGRPAPRVVKMDIEGGEVLALPGMRRILAESRPLMLVELHGPESVQAAWEVLSAAGYSLHRMETGYPQVQSPDELDWKAYLIGMPPEI